jgi:hypothetical protein
MSYQEFQQEPTGKAVTSALSAQSAGGVYTKPPQPLPILFLRTLVAKVQSAIRRRPPTDVPRKTNSDSRLLDPVDGGTIREWDDSVCELPVGEEVQLRSLWMTEAYPPSCLPALVEALARLGWDVPNRYGANALSPDKLREARAGRGLGFCGFETMAPVGELNEILGYRAAEIPRGFERLGVTVHHPVPSITVIVFQFVLGYEASRELTELFQREDPALLEESPNAWIQRTGPLRSQMRAAVTAVRERQRRVCAEWVSLRVPGLFTALGGVPATEFITLEKAEPLQRDGAYTPGYIQALGLHHTFYASELWGRQGLRLEWPIHYNSTGNLLFSGRMNELYDLENPDGSDSFMDCVNRHVRDALVPWSLYEAVRRSTEQIALLRDRVAEVAAGDPVTAVAALGIVQREFMRLVVDTVPMEREIRELCADPKLYHRESSDEYRFIEKYRSERQEDDHVFEHVRTKTLATAEQLTRLSTDLSSMIATTSSVLNSFAQERATEENLRLQRRVSWMTVVFGVLAAVLSVLQILG